jgi:hypothetical protein
VIGLWRRGDRTHPGHVGSISGGERAAERGRPDAGRVKSSLTGRVRSLKPRSGGLLELTGHCWAVRLVTLSCVRSSAGPHGRARDRTQGPCIRSLSGASDRSLTDWLTVFDLLKSSKRS